MIEPEDVPAEIVDWCQGPDYSGPGVRQALARSLSHWDALQGRACRWRYLGHQHETDNRGLGPIAQMVSGVSSTHRTVVLQGCAEHGEKVVISLAGHWDEAALRRLETSVVIVEDAKSGHSAT